MIVCEELASEMRLALIDIVLMADSKQIEQWLQDGYDESEAIGTYQRPAGFIAARKRAGRRPSFGGPPPEWGPQTERRGQSVSRMSLIEEYLEHHRDQCSDCGPWE